MKAHDIRRIAVEAGRDPRTVEAVIEGGGSDLSRVAVENAMKRLGIAVAPTARRSTPPDAA